VELTLYNKIPHLLTPVITDAKKTILALKWAGKEMSRRYDLLEEHACKDIDSYHKNVLAPALQKAFKEDDQLIIEEFISGREFTIGVVRIDGKIWVLPATEVISSKEFFDFEAKYTTGLSEEITPGRMSEAEIAKVQEMAAAIYERLNCAGVVRIDYIINETGLIYVLEINTVPGQSENSIIPQQVRATGMDMTTFYGLLVTEALK
jgi:D-alanine-D-alanine ligase